MDPIQLGMLIAAIAGLTLVMISTRRKFRARAGKRDPTVRQQYRRLERETAAKRGIDEAIIELDHLSREIHARIDTKFAKLEAVIRDADDRIERLSRQVRNQPGDAACDVMLKPEHPAESAPARRSDTPSLDRAPSTAADSTSPPSKRHREILDLADRGLSAQAIAERIARPVGEVELILSLEKAKAGAGPPDGLSALA